MPKYSGENAINAIHNRILTEIKRQLFSDLSHKEIAFDLGFSPSALNKFVRAKLKKLNRPSKRTGAKFIYNILPLLTYLCTSNII
jgi:hypothetical protein